jgi:hypothetical protein
MPKVRNRAQASESAAISSPDLTNSCAIAFYAAIWTAVAALVAHVFFRY